jgi:hypothetical protein
MKSNYGLEVGEEYDNIRRSNNAIVRTALHGQLSNPQLQAIDKRVRARVSNIAHFFDETFSVEELLREAARSEVLAAINPGQASVEQNLGMEILAAMSSTDVTDQNTNRAA